MFFYSRKSRPLVIAHRGASLEAPENTLAAFAQALEIGADGVELDLWQSKDHHLMVIHDNWLERLCGLNSSVEQLSLRELKHLDVGKHFSQKFLGERIPVLEEVFELLQGKVLINVEIKGLRIRGNGLEERLVHLIRRKKMTDQVVLSSFNVLALRRVHKIAPEIRRGLLLYERQFLHSKLGDWTRFLKPYSLHLSWGLLEEYPLALLHERGVQSWIWTINEEQEMKRLVEQGVDAIITDNPRKLIQLL